MKKPTRVLVVCKFNQNRSRAGEAVLTEMYKERGHTVGTLEDKTGFDYYVGSAGMECRNTKDSKKYSSELGDSVDFIFAADRQIDMQLELYFNVPRKKLANLRIPDDYNITYPDDEFALKNLLREKLEEYMPKRKK